MGGGSDDERPRSPTNFLAGSAHSQEAPRVVTILNVRCPAFQESARGVSVAADTTLVQLLAHLAAARPELARSGAALQQAAGPGPGLSPSPPSPGQAVPTRRRLYAVVDATLHPLRPVCGPGGVYPLTLVAARGRTVHQLGLWPSATIDLYFTEEAGATPADGDAALGGSEGGGAAEAAVVDGGRVPGQEGDVTWTVVVKPVHSPADRITIKYLKPSDTVHVLKCRCEERYLDVGFSPPPLPPTLPLAVDLSPLPTGWQCSGRTRWRPRRAWWQCTAAGSSKTTSAWQPTA
jgi:hypothetical protein